MSLRLSRAHSNTPHRGAAVPPGFTDDYTGTAGAAWKAGWTFVSVAGVATLDGSGRGKLVTGAAGNYSDRWNAQTTTATGTDAKVTFVGIDKTIDHQTVLGFGTDGTAATYTHVPLNGYVVKMTTYNSTFVLQKIVNGSSTDLGSVVVTLTAADNVTVEAIIGGGVYVSRNGAARPATPSIAWPAGETTYAAGHAGVGLQSSGAAQARTFLFDDFSLT